jgi:hypothetical protein
MCSEVVLIWFLILCLMCSQRSFLYTFQPRKVINSAHLRGTIINRNNNLVDAEGKNNIQLRADVTPSQSQVPMFVKNVMDQVNTSILSKLRGSNDSIIDNNASSEKKMTSISIDVKVTITTTKDTDVTIDLSQQRTVDEESIPDQMPFILPSLGDDTVTLHDLPSTSSEDDYDENGHTNSHVTVQTISDDYYVVDRSDVYADGKVDEKME